MIIERRTSWKLELLQVAIKVTVIFRTTNFLIFLSIGISFLGI